MRGGQIIDAEGEGRNRLSFIENAILEEFKKTNKNKIHAKIMTKDGVNDKVKRYGKALGGGVLEMSSKSKRRGFYLQDSYRQGWDNILGIQFYEEPEDKTYAHELVLAQRYFEKNRHPNLWDDLAKKYSFTQQQLEDFAKATHGLGHFESWQKAGEMNMPKIEGHKTITMKSAGMPEWARNNLKDAIENKRPYSNRWNCGWDCSVSVEQGTDGIWRGWFSQEYKGTGNGHYWLLISPEHAIFAEND